MRTRKQHRAWYHPGLGRASARGSSQNGVRLRREPIISRRKALNLRRSMMYNSKRNKLCLLRAFLKWNSSTGKAAARMSPLTRLPKPRFSSLEKTEHSGVRPSALGHASPPSAGRRPPKQAGFSRAGHGHAPGPVARAARRSWQGGWGQLLGLH